MKEYEEQLIEDYFKGTLSSEALDAFEKRVREDLAFKEEVQLHREAIRAVQLLGEVQMKEQLEALEQGPGNKKRLFYAIAASITLLIAIGLTYFFTKAPSSEQLYTTYFNSYPDERAQRDHHKDNPDHFDEAMKLYNTNEYAKAIPHFSQALNDDAANMSIQLYAAISYMQTNRMEEAVRLLEHIQQQDSKYSGVAQWYLALAYLHLKETTKAKEQLNAIAKEMNTYQHEAAIGLLKKLKRSEK